MPMQYEYLTAEKETFRTLLFGPYGSSKTTVATSAHFSSKLGPALVLDIDGGLTSVTHHENLVQVPVHSFKELEQVVNDLTLPAERRPSIINGIKTVIFDSVSAIRDEILVEFTGQQFKKQKREDAYSPEWKDYGKMTNFILNKSDDFRKAGFNLIITAGSVDIMDGERIVATRPNLNRALLDGLNYRMSNIWYVERSKTDNRYRMLVVPPKASQRFDIKTRNAEFAAALTKLTRQQAVERKEKESDKWEGWYLIPDHLHPTLPNLYDVYLETSRKG